MKTRLITAAVGVPFLIFVLVVRGWFAELVIALLTIIAMRECYRALGKAGYNVCTWGGYAAAVAMWPLSRAAGPASSGAGTEASPRSDGAKSSSAARGAAPEELPSLSEYPQRGDTQDGGDNS